MFKYKLTKDDLVHIIARLTNYLAQSKSLAFALDNQSYQLDNNKFLDAVFALLRYPKGDSSSWQTHIKEFKNVIEDVDKKGYDIVIDLSEGGFLPSIFNVSKLAQSGNEPLDSSAVNKGLCAVPIPDRMPLKTFYDGILENVLPGLVVVMGPTFSGKTTYIKNEIKPDIIIRYGEPFEDLDFTYNIVLHPTSLVEVLSNSVILGVLGFKVAIDSLRSIVFSIGGPASAGGVRVLIYNLITNLSNLYSNLNIVVVSVINPLVADNDYQLLYSNIMSACSGVISIIDQTVHSSSCRKISGRTGNFDYSNNVPDDSQSHKVHRIFKDVAVSGVSAANPLSPISVDTVDEDEDFNQQIIF